MKALLEVRRNLFHSCRFTDVTFGFVWITFSSKNTETMKVNVIFYALDIKTYLHTCDVSVFQSILLELHLL